MSGEIGIRVAGNGLVGFCGNRGEGIEGGKDVVSEETLLQEIMLSRPRLLEGP
jgi:hypothetical protein